MQTALQTSGAKISSLPRGQQSSISDLYALLKQTGDLRFANVLQIQK